MSSSEMSRISENVKLGIGIPLWIYDHYSNKRGKKGGGGEGTSLNSQLKQPETKHCE